MRRVSLILWFAAVATALLPHATSHAAPANGHVETGLTMSIPRLGRDVTYTLYMPDRRANPTQPVPVLYLLHGRDDNELAWLNNGQIASTLDRMIAAGTLPPIAVVMPMAGNSWYVDDARGKSGFGPIATAFLEDFIPAIERRHALASCRNARAVGGLSMGGYGAALYALTRPDLFTSAISLSGSLFSDQPAEIETRLPFYNRVLSGIHGDPFDRERFRSWTVFARLENAPPEIEKLGVWLAAGDGDFAGIISGTVRLHQDLRRRKIESHLRIYDGDHTWPLWTMAIEPALTWLAPRLDATCAAAKP
jgi:S-formylglutathione hydrolase FrmB